MLEDIVGQGGSQQEDSPMVVISAEPEKLGIIVNVN